MVTSSDNKYCSQNTSSLQQMKFYKSIEEYRQSLGSHKTTRLYPDFLEEDISPQHTRIYYIMANNSNDSFPIPNVIKFFVPKTFREEVVTQLARLSPVRDQENIHRELNCIQEGDHFLIDVENIQWSDVLKIQSELWVILAKKQSKTECIYNLLLNNMYQSWSNEERFVFQNTFGVSLQYMGGENFDSFLMVKTWSNSVMNVGKEGLQSLKKSAKLPSELNREEFDAILKKFPREQQEPVSADEKPVAAFSKAPGSKVSENSLNRRWHISSSNYKTTEVETNKSFYPTLINTVDTPKVEKILDKECSTASTPVVRTIFNEEASPREYRRRMDSGESKDQLIFVGRNHGVFTPSELNDHTEGLLEELAHEKNRRPANFFKSTYGTESSEDDSDLEIQKIAIRLKEGNSSVASCFDVATSGREDLTSSEDETDHEEQEQKFGSVDSIASTLKEEETIHSSVVAEYVNLSEEELLEKFKEKEDWEMINTWGAANWNKDLTEFNAWREEAIEKYFLSLLSEEELGTFGALMHLPVVAEFVAGLGEEQQRVYDQWKNKPIPAVPSFVPELKLTPQQEKIFLPLIKEKRFAALDEWMKFNTAYENLYNLWKKAVKAPVSDSREAVQATLLETKSLRNESSAEQPAEVVAMTYLPPPAETEVSQECASPVWSEVASTTDSFIKEKNEDNPAESDQESEELKHQSIENQTETDVIESDAHISGSTLLETIVTSNADVVESDREMDEQGSNLSGQPSIAILNIAESAVEEPLSMVSEQSTTDSEQKIGSKVQEHVNSLLSTLEEPKESEMTERQQSEIDTDPSVTIIDSSTGNTVVHISIYKNESEGANLDTTQSTVETIDNETSGGAQNENTGSHHETLTKSITPENHEIIDVQEEKQECEDKNETNTSLVNGAGEVDVSEPLEAAPPVIPTRTESNNTLFSLAFDVLTSRVSPKPIEQNRGPATWTSALLNTFLNEPISEPSSILSTDEHNLEQQKSSVLATPVVATPTMNIAQSQNLNQNFTNYMEKSLDETSNAAKNESSEETKTTIDLKNDNSTEVTSSTVSLPADLHINDQYQRNEECLSPVDDLASIGRECTSLRELHSSESSLLSPTKLGEVDENGDNFVDETRTPTPTSLAEFEHISASEVDESKRDTSNY